MDALSDLLRAVRLTGAVFFDVRACDPWVATAPPGRTIVARIFPGSDHLVSYHVITRGHCWAALEGEEPLPLTTGDIIVFPHGDMHSLASAPGMRDPSDLPDHSHYSRSEDEQLPFRIALGDSGVESAHLVCGFLGCDTRPFNPLLAALPRVIRVSEQQGGAIATFVQVAISEVRERRPGSEAVLSRLSELMFVDVLRRYLDTLPDDRTGWLAGLRDPAVGHVLTLIHQHPSRPWTLESLAHEAAVSRSVLAERFAQLVGQPPMQYLTNWRMQLAANHLVTGTDMATIAERIGYSSETAFSRAFKRTVGVAPRDWRDGARAASVSGAAVG